MDAYKSVNASWPFATSAVAGNGRSRKIRRATRSGTGQQRNRSTPTSMADFGDPESRRVFDAAASAVARELGRQAGREWYDLMERKERG